MKRLFRFAGIIVMLLPAFAQAATNEEYNMLKGWLLGSAYSYLTASWGQYNCSLWGKYNSSCKHPGVDYGTNSQYINVYSVGSGVVTRADSNPPPSNSVGQVCVYHSSRNVTLCYLHLSSIYARTGQTISQGTVIGRTGKTGASAVHLHFEARSGKQTSATYNYYSTIDPYSAAISVR